ncbi:tetratricopeptide repeat protein [Acidobacteriota bacterium]
MIYRISRIISVTFVFLFALSHVWLHAQEAYASRNFMLADEALLQGRFEEAIVFYKKGIVSASEITSGSTRPKYDAELIFDNLGYAYLQIGDFDNAKIFLKKSLRRFPVNYNARFYMAVAQLMSDNLDLSLQELKRIERDVCFDDTWIIKGQSYQKSNGAIVGQDVVERIRKCRGVFVEGKGDIKLVHLNAFNAMNEGGFYFTWGIVCRKKGEFTRAEEYFMKVIEAQYDENDVRLWLADAYLSQNRRQDAEAVIEQMLKIQADHSRVLKFKNLANTPGDYRTPELLDNIRIHIHHRLEDHGADFAAAQHDQFFQVLRQGRIRDSVKILESALDSRVRSFVVNHNLAMMYLDLAKMQGLNPEYLNQAEIYCARALWFTDYEEITVKHEVSAYDLMGAIYYHQKKYDKAITEFRKALELDPYDSDIRCSLGSIFYKIDDDNNAEQEWLKIIEYEKRRVKLKEDKSKEGKLQHSLWVEKIPSLYRAHVNLGTLYIYQGSTDKALEHLKQAIQIEPNRPDPYFELGNIYHQSGEMEAAKEAYEKYLFLGGKKADKVRERLNSIRKKD